MPFSFFASLFISFSVSFSAVPLTASLARRVGAIDIPDGCRRCHRAITPRMTGIAVALGFSAALLLLPAEKSGVTAALLLYGNAVCLSGALDDLYPLSPPKKLLLQLLAAVGAALCGVRPLWLPAPYAFPVAVLFLLLLMNAQNLVDGMDGLSASLALISALGFSSLAIRCGDTALLPALLLFTVAVIGFLPYNLPPARVFMGDAGSQFLGFTLAALGIALSNRILLPQASAIAASRTTFALLLCLFLPIYDTVTSFFRRFFSGTSPFSADRGHLHHRLIDKGFSDTAALSLLLLAQSAFTLFGISII